MQHCHLGASDIVHMSLQLLELTGLASLLDTLNVLFSVSRLVIDRLARCSRIEALVRHKCIDGIIENSLIACPLIGHCKCKKINAYWSYTKYSIHFLA